MQARYFLDVRESCGQYNAGPNILEMQHGLVDDQHKWELGITQAQCFHNTVDARIPVESLMCRRAELQSKLKVS